MFLNRIQPYLISLVSRTLKAAKVPIKIAPAMQSDQPLTRNDNVHEAQSALLTHCKSNVEGNAQYRSPITTLVKNPQLRLLNALRAGSKPIMTFLGLSTFRAAQIVAQTGLDVGFFRSHSQSSD